MTMQEMTAIANKPGMPVTKDVRAIAARAMIEALFAGRKDQAKECGDALNKSVRKFGKP